MSVPQPQAMFVYGTLKQGGVRAPLWPRRAVRIEAATTRGQLRDLGPYPALLDGDDSVLGELWFLAPEDVGVTLQVLDRVECYDQGGVDLYVRRVITCQTLAGQTCQAHAYFYAAPERIADKPVVLPGPGGYCQWPSPS